jgi:Fic family protein
MRLLNATHARLMRGVRGATKLPGEIRRSQNWIGGSRPGNATFVPPPPHLLAEGLTALEQYLHTDDSTHPIVRAGLLHVQFETLHPYSTAAGGWAAS